MEGLTYYPDEFFNYNKKCGKYRKYGSTKPKEKARPKRHKTYGKNK